MLEDRGLFPFLLVQLYGFDRGEDAKRMSLLTRSCVVWGLDMRFCWVFRGGNFVTRCKSVNTLPNSDWTFEHSWGLRANSRFLRCAAE